MRDHLAAFEVERTDMFAGEVMVSRAADKVLEPAHHRCASGAAREVDAPLLPAMLESLGTPCVSG